MNKQRHTTLLSLITMSMMMMLYSCTDDLGIRDTDLPSEYLRFTAKLGGSAITATTRSTAGHVEIEEEEWLVGNPKAEKGGDTRGTLTTGMDGDVGISGVAVSGSFANEKYSFDGDELINTSPIRWSTISSNEQITFFAYAPYKTSTELASAPFSNYNATDMTVTYTVPNNISEQIDLIADTTVVKQAQFKETVGFEFEHLLTAIRFKAGFDCWVKQIEVKNVYDQGTFSFVNNTVTKAEGSSIVSYTIDFSSKPLKAKLDDVISVTQTDEKNTEDQILLMIPQTLPNETEKKATVTLTYYESQEDADDSKNEKTISADIGGKTWDAGKLITYKIYDQEPEYIYLDLAAGDITINASTYTGYKYVKNNDDTFVSQAISGAHDAKNIYYVYQSTASFNDGTYKIEDNRDKVGDINGTFHRPSYPAVEGPYGGTWADYITNNKSVEDIIEMWDDAKNIVTEHIIETEERKKYAMVRKAGRTHTPHKIDISGDITCQLTIDNIYSSYQQKAVSRTSAGLSFIPKGSNNKLYINIIGDNRLGAVHYSNTTENGNEIIFGGTGSLTVADTDFDTDFHNSFTYHGLGDNEQEYEYSGYISNHWCAAIGNNDSQDKCYGIVINSGIIFTGTTKAENCTAIGGGGNGYGGVTINGGTVTAVASTTGSAIGGGIGYNSGGGQGNVTIKNGNVYAYNFENRWKIPSSAIGGAGSRHANGALGTVTISGGNIYAESILGTAIGGGSSATKQGGNAKITITGGKVVAKSGAGTGIGGGSACTHAVDGSSDKNNPPPYNGGTATIAINNSNGTPIIRTSSIGGGYTNDPKGGKKGSAEISVDGGDIQAQFIMEAGTKAKPIFKMNGGTIRNSNVIEKESTDSNDKYGGAVYMQDGEFEMTGGRIEKCSALKGGAVYIEDPIPDDESVPTFTMSGGIIEYCTSNTDGGAVYMAGGNAIVKGTAKIIYNIAQGGNGGGICIEQGDFTMSDNTPCIQNNTALYKNSKGGNGGGVYVSSSDADVAVNLIGGYIQNNTTDRNGGGIHVDMGNSKKTATIIVGGDSNGPTITGNHTILAGGGLYAKGTGANITINSGEIRNNSVSGFVDNEDVANELGTVTLKGGDVDHKVITYNGNNGYVRYSDTDEWTTTTTQKIVTNTNSKFVYPTTSRAGWKFKGWNDRSDGLGNPYPENYSVPQSENLTLYAQWELE